MTLVRCLPLNKRRALAPLLMAFGLVAQASLAAAQGPEATATEPPPAPAASEAAPAQPAAAAPTQPVVQTPLAAPAPLAAPEEPHARLDYSDGTFYLRSHNDNIVFVPAARAHLDTYAFGGPGVSDYHRSGNNTGLKTNMFFRRFIIEFGGLVRKKIFYWMGGNFSPTAVDPNSPSQGILNPGSVYDGFVGWVPKPTLRLYFGQYNAPFTMENVTSSRWLDLMERALTVRTLATPHNKADGLMVWGDTEHKHFEYQLGVFGGDGMNRPNIDNRVDGMSRIVVRPLASRADALKRFHVGGGFRYGWRDTKSVRYDAPSLTTPGGFAFWSPSYGSGMNETRILPSREQMAVAGEFYVPFERFDVRGEVLYLNEGRREVLASDRSKTQRAGHLKGAGGYLQLSVWLAGTPRINGNPAGNYGVLKLPDGLGTQAPFALQLVARAELMRLKYDANDFHGDTPGGLSSATNDIKVNAYQLGLNYWATKHIRLTAEYSLYHFPGTPIGGNGGIENQAIAPGAKAGKEPGANTLNEISFRVGLAI